MNQFLRTYALDDIHVRSGGDGRTVEAYAAIFNTEAPIEDQDGHYREMIAPTAFAKTLAERGTRFGVFFNHARTIDGFPSDRFSVPLGRPLEIRADAKGLLTVTRYSQTDLADQILESIRSGAITAQSFSGAYVKSRPQRPPRGGYRMASNGDLQLVTRMEIAMREYGPAALAAYEGADIIGVRSLGALLGLNETQRLALLQHLGGATLLEPGRPLSATPSRAGDLVEEPREHSARPMSLRTRVHAARIARGISECTNGNQARGGDPHPSGDDRD
jgi:HK97 family phage prohead protease